MLYIKKLDDGVEIFKALGSELRIQILKLLLEQQEMNMNELAVGIIQDNAVGIVHAVFIHAAGRNHICDFTGKDHAGKIQRINADV